MSFTDPTPAPIGQQLRALRESRGLTLQELADQIGTSAPAMHRYEGLWEGLTLRTLRRIANALEAEVEIRLRPQYRSDVHGTSGRSTTPREMLDQIRPLLWDVEPSASLLDENRVWVLTRVFNEGDIQQVRAALAYFDPQVVRQTLTRRDLSPRARSFVAAYLQGDADAP